MEINPILPRLLDPNMSVRFREPRARQQLIQKLLPACMVVPPVTVDNVAFIVVLPVMSLVLVVMSSIPLLEVLPPQANNAGRLIIREVLPSRTLPRLKLLMARRKCPVNDVIPPPPLPTPISAELLVPLRRGLKPHIPATFPVRVIPPTIGNVPAMPVLYALLTRTVQPFDLPPRTLLKCLSATPLNIRLVGRPAILEQQLNGALLRSVLPIVALPFVLIVPVSDGNVSLARLSAVVVI